MFYAQACVAVPFQGDCSFSRHNLRFASSANVANNSSKTKMLVPSKHATAQACCKLKVQAAQVLKACHDAGTKYKTSECLLEA